MSVRKGQARLRKLVNFLENLPNSNEDTEFLKSALKEIASGKDANIALRVKAKRGERKGEYSRKTKIQKAYAMTWIASAVLPEDQDGLGYSITKAVSQVKKLLPDLPAESSLIRNYNDYKKIGTELFGMQPSKIWI